MKFTSVQRNEGDGMRKGTRSTLKAFVVTGVLLLVLTLGKVDDAQAALRTVRRSLVDSPTSNPGEQECPTGKGSEYATCAAKFTDVMDQLKCGTCRLYVGSPCTMDQLMECAIRDSDIPATDVSEIWQYAERVCAPKCLPDCKKDTFKDCLIESGGLLSREGACYKNRCKAGSAKESGTDSPPKTGSPLPSPVTGTPPTAGDSTNDAPTTPAAEGNSAESSADGPSARRLFFFFPSLAAPLIVSAFFLLVPEGG